MINPEWFGPLLVFESWRLLIPRVTALFVDSGILLLKLPGMANYCIPPWGIRIWIELPWKFPKIGFNDPLFSSKCSIRGFARAMGESDSTSWADYAFDRARLGRFQIVLGASIRRGIFYRFSYSDARFTRCRRAR